MQCIVSDFLFQVSISHCSIGYYLSHTGSDYTLRGWGYHGEDIEVMRLVLRDEMTMEMMGEVITSITQAVEKLLDQA